MCRCGKGCQPDRPVIFRRESMFYPILTFRCDDLAHHASLNPGTVEIQDALTGERLWPEGAQQC